MKKLLYTIVTLCLTVNATGFAQEVVSFKDWKKNKVQEVQADITQLESIQKASSVRFGPEEQSKLKQSHINLDIAEDLNAQDYFILYLSPKLQSDQQAYSKAVQMMTPDEVAQILVGYDKLIEERKKKNLIPIESMKFGFSSPKVLDPDIQVSAITK